MFNKEEKNENSCYLTEVKDNEININPKIFYLFNNFLIKENKNHFSRKKFSKIKEIMPEYLDIDSQIQKKISDIRDYYGIIPIFKQMQSENSYVMTIFKKGFRQMFFGPKGIVTQKNMDLKNYYKSFEPKSDLNSKIYAGSLDYYDFLTGYNSFFERLKNSRKRLLKINGNFSVSNSVSGKLHEAYILKLEKRKQKNALIKNIAKNKNKNIFNKSNNNIEKKDIRNKTINNFYNNSYTKRKKLYFPLGKGKYKNDSLKKQNLFLNFKNNTNILNQKERSINVTPCKTGKKQSHTNLSIITSLNGAELRNNERQKTDIYSNTRDDKRNLTNITTLSNKNKDNNSIFILKTPIKSIDKKNKLKIIGSYHNSSFKPSIINKKKENLIQSENKTISNKSLKYPNYAKKKSLFGAKHNKQFSDSINSIKLSLTNQIKSTIPKGRKFEHSLNKFVDNNKKYELKTKDLFKRKIRNEIHELKEDMRNTKDYHDLAKNVDFSDKRVFSPRNNHKGNTRLKGASFNLAFSFRTRLEQNLPIKEFLQNIEEIKEKEKEKKFFKMIRKNFRKNIKVIHNLTLSLEHAKKNINY